MIDKVKLRALIVTLRRALLMAAQACEVFLEDTHDTEETGVIVDS